VTLGCAHHGAPAAQSAPYDFAQDGSDSVRPGSCCTRSERALSASEVSSLGPSVEQQLADTGALRCTLHLGTGGTREVVLRATLPEQVVLHEASAEEGCNLCFSELTFQASLRAESSDPRLQLGRDGVVFRRLGAGESLVFEDVHGGLRLSGAYGAHEPSLVMFAEKPGGFERLAGTESWCVPVP
jgi:hypothetical protein